MDTAIERTKFEKWAGANDWPTARMNGNPDRYVEPGTQQEWQLWRVNARLNALEKAVWHLQQHHNC